MKPLPSEFDSVSRELATYYRALPDLLAQKQEGKYVVIRGDAIHDVWDTYRDAIQFGRLTFGDEDFLAQVIDRRFLSVLRPYFDQAEAPGAEVA